MPDWKRFSNIFYINDYKDIIIEKAKGCSITDENGKDYLDFASGQHCAILGHNHPSLLKALNKQSQDAIHLGTTFLSRPVLDASKKISQIAPNGLDKVVLLSTGAEANECALEIAKCITGKKTAAGFGKGYVGATSQLKALKPIITPDCKNCPKSLNYPECKIKCIDKSIKKEYCAAIVEPILSEAGIVIPPKGYFRKLQRVCKNKGVLLIIDEAQTGFGRTGSWFAAEIRPDILVFSKTAGSGYPVSGLVTSKEIESKAIKKGISHISSHQSDPMAGTAVIAVIDTIKKESLLSHVAHKGNYLAEQLNALKKKHKCLGEIRGRGLMIGIDVDADILSLKKTLLKNGLYAVFSRNTLKLMPPLIVSEKEIDKTIEIIDKSLTKTEKIQSKNPYSRENRGILRKTMLGFHN